MRPASVSVYLPLTLSLSPSLSLPVSFTFVEHTLISFALTERDHTPPHRAGGEDRAQHADQRVRESDLQIFRSERVNN